MNTTLAKQHLNIGLVRLRVQVIDQEDRQIHPPCVPPWRQFLHHHLTARNAYRLLRQQYLSRKALRISPPVVPVHTKRWWERNSALCTAHSTMSALRLSCATSAMVSFLFITNTSYIYCSILFSIFSVALMAASVWSASRPRVLKSIRHNSS